MTRSRDNFDDDLTSVQKMQKLGVQIDQNEQRGQAAQVGSGEYANSDENAIQSDQASPSGQSDSVIKKRVPNNISSSISGVDAIGDDVAEKRANLLGAQGSPQLGRRESPEPYDPWPKRKMYIQGIVFGAIVIICVLVTLVAMGSGSTIGV